MNGSRKLSSQEIAATLRERIRSGDLRPGERLPTQAELAEEFGVERGTVRQALRALQDDGLLVTYPGRGTFVADILSNSGALANHETLLAVIQKYRP